jgi:hypothetical protein
MRKLALSIAAAAVVFTAAPALAQGIYVGPRGFGVDVAPRYYRDYDYPPGWYRGHHYGWYRHHRFSRDWDYD